MDFYLLRFVVFVSILTTIMGCSRVNEDKSQFTLMLSGQTGINFINENHETEQSNILSYEYYYNGGGVALGDINNDGLTDIYFTSNIFSNKLYLNEGNFKFKDITEESGTACEVGWKTGVTMADVNGDGLLDIYVCRSASPDKERRRNMLLINNGDLTFTDKAKEYNLDDGSYSTQAAFFDFDRDNDLDVLLLNHSLLEISNVFNITVKNSNARFPEVGNKLFRNDNGKFIDVSDSTGVFGSAFNYGLGVSISDINNDGWPDIYTGCDYTGRDRMLFNDHGKFFIDVTNQLSHISKFTMGTDIADINGDQNMDILTLDMLPEDNYRQKQLMGSDRYDVFNTMVKSGLHAQYMRNMLHLNNGNGTFSEIGQLAGLSNTDWSWSALIQDFDNDGEQDVFISNGFKRDLTNNDFAKFQVAAQMEESRKQGKKFSKLDMIEKFAENKLPNYTFRGNGDLTFTDVTKSWGFFEPSVTNGVAYGDLDNDGDLDIVTNNMNDKAGIYKNNAEQSGNSFVSFKMEGKGNRFSIGAKVTVYARSKSWVKEIFPVRGFQSSVDYNLNFGLGKIKTIDSVQVLWPSGHVSVVKSVRVNKLNVIKEVETTAPYSNSSIKTLFIEQAGISFRHHENEFNDFDIQRLLPRKYSTEGPAMAKADLNNDGLEDFFISGAKGQPSKLFIQNRNKGFTERQQNVFDVCINSEVVDAVFFDIDQDNDEDLYVVTGGYEFGLDDKALADYLFENKGQGNFVMKALPSILSSGSCARPADIDHDGDLDLFVGSRIVPGRYPETPESYLLINDGKGNFSRSESESITKLGMVTDAQWMELNNDEYPELVVVGEWMAVKVFMNTQGMLQDQTSTTMPRYTEGFWNCVQVVDFDKDGDMDFVAGNFGINNQMKPSPDKPASLYFADYDNNGSVDPIIDYFVKDASYPYPTRDELIEQLPSFRKRFTNYHSYSIAQINQLLTVDELKKSQVLKAYQLKSCLFRNDSGKFTMIPLPNEFQLAPVFAMLLLDINNDKHPDLVTAGNFTGTRSRTGKLTGNYGVVGVNDGKGMFKVMKPTETGLALTGDVRSLLQIGVCIMIGVNDQNVLIYRMAGNGQ